jgi:hypothetical protein
VWYLHEVLGEDQISRTGDDGHGVVGGFDEPFATLLIIRESTSVMRIIM